LTELPVRAIVKRQKNQNNPECFRDKGEKSMSIVSVGLLIVSVLTTQGTPATAPTKGEVQKPMVTLETNKGKIVFEMYPEVAPKTVARITELIQQKFYDGLTFHRVVPGFVIQGGDPAGNGTGGSGIKLPAEFNSLKHHPGTVAMARANDPNSADCQFYICLGTPSSLDGNYTIFGQVVEGMEVVQKIQVGDKMNKVTVKLPAVQKPIELKPADEKKRIDAWLKKNKLNQFGDPEGLTYAGGTPIFNETTGKKQDRYEFLRNKFPDKPWNQ
jgi:cyclophilin family peptidyl-prolyl cis-trans isomerase